MRAEQILSTVQNRVVDFQFEKYAKFKPHSVIIQKRFSNSKPGPQTNLNSLVNLEKGTSGQWTGYLSPGTRRRVKGIIENFLTAVQLNTSMVFPKSFPSTEIYPTFMTLTLPSKQFHSDQDIKAECFDRFIEWLRGEKSKGYSGWEVKNYIWVAETQKNGNIHFHVIIDRALHKEMINRKWNHYLEHLGYVTRFRNKQNYIYTNILTGKPEFKVRKEMMKHKIEAKRKEYRITGKSFDYKEAVKVERKRQEEAYARGLKSNWNNPPTTQIHKIDNIQKLTAYVSKYMTKAPEVNIKLQVGETLLEENAKYYILTETVEKDISIEGHEIETVTKNRQEVKVNFRSRYIRGRVWGASRILHTEDLTPMTIVLESFSRVTVSTTVQKPVHYQTAVYINDIFGEPVYSHMAKDVKYFESTEMNSTYEPPIIDSDAARFVQFLSEVHVPKADIDSATAKAGEQFQHFGGVIIPLKDPVKDIMAKFSKPMRQRYNEFYTQMFKTIYPVEYAS